MRILTLSDPVWLFPPTGYSKSMDLATQQLKRDHVVGHIPMNRAIYGISHMRPYVRKGIYICESGMNEFGEDVVVPHYRKFKADMVITFKDLWVFNQIGRMPVNWVPIVALDHSPPSNEILSRVKTAFKVVTISRFGQREMRTAGVPSTYIPLMVDLDEYKPMEDRKACKRQFFLPEDELTLGFVGMNSVRKMIPRILEGIKLFRDNNPDLKFRFIMWTRIIPEILSGGESRGVYLEPKIQKLGLSDIVHSPEIGTYDIGFTEDYMCKLYNAIDVLVCGSAEGFWLPGLEAGACGTPAVTVDFAAAPEVVGAGYTVKVADTVNINPIGYDTPLFDKDDFSEKLSRLINQDMEKMRKRARRYALKYGMERVYSTYWKPFLEESETVLRPHITKSGIKPWILT